MKDFLEFLTEMQAHHTEEPYSNITLGEYLNKALNIENATCDEQDMVLSDYFEKYTNATIPTKKSGFGKEFEWEYIYELGSYLTLTNLSISNAEEKYRRRIFESCKFKTSINIKSSILDFKYCDFMRIKQSVIQGKPSSLDMLFLNIDTCNFLSCQNIKFQNCSIKSNTHGNIFKNCGALNFKNCIVEGVFKGCKVIKFYGCDTVILSEEHVTDFDFQNCHVKFSENYNNTTYEKCSFSNCTIYDTNREHFIDCSFTNCKDANGNKISI